MTEGAGRMLEETGDEDATEFGVIESPADGAGGGLGVEREVSPLLGRDVHGGAARNHGACKRKVSVLFMVLCLRTWDGLKEWQGLTSPPHDIIIKSTSTTGVTVHVDRQVKRFFFCLL